MKLPAAKYAKTLWYNFLNYMMCDFAYPFYASYKITTMCDRRCEFCNVWMENTPDLSTSDVYKLLDNINESSIILLSIEGGEPLLRKDISEILAHTANKSFYILLTTSGEQFHRVNMDEATKYIDFLHISIDEGHDNLYLFEELESFTKWRSIICVQIVVRKQDLAFLEEKIKKCYSAGVKAVVMPACHLPNTKNVFPDISKFANRVLELRKKYPNTIITTPKYLRGMLKNKSCNASSIIIDSDGKLFYPCRTLGNKPFDLLKERLSDILISQEAKKYRAMMKNCKKACHWYQYFATDSFTTPKNFLYSLTPYMKNFFAGKKNVRSAKQTG